MTQADKLQALMQKAIEGGYEPDDWVQGPQHLAQSLMHMDRVNSVIFNHDFAKALFGDKQIQVSEYSHSDVFNGKGCCSKYLVACDYHLQQAVIADDPIGYMYRAVFGE